MHLGVIGATGTIGSRVVTEALARGHHVTAFTRDSTQIDEDRGNVVWKSLDVLDAASVAAGISGLDVLISGFQPGNAAKDIADTVARSIADPTVYATAARSLLKALESHPRTRLIVIGGAGSLEIEPGVVRADSDELLHSSLDALGLPRQYAAAVRGHRDALNVLRTSNRLWTYFSPRRTSLPASARAGSGPAAISRFSTRRGVAASRWRTRPSHSSTRPNCPASSNAASRSAIERTPADPRRNRDRHRASAGGPASGRAGTPRCRRWCGAAGRHVPRQPVVSTMRKRAAPDIIFRYASSAWSSGTVSVIGRIPCRALNAMVSCTSCAVPDG